MDTPFTRRHGRLTLQPGSRRLIVDGEPVKIGARAFDLLAALIERRERVVTKDELLDLVWPGVIVEEANLHVQIAGLRKLVGSGAIATVPGRGYQFVAPETATPAAAPLPALAKLGRRRLVWRWGAAVAAVVVLALAGWFTFGRAPTFANPPVFAAMPFAAVGDDPLAAQLAAGVTAIIATDLGRIPSLRVIADLKTSAYARTRADARQIARDLKADYVLTGAAKRDGDKVETSATLTDGATGETLWENRWRAAVSDDLIAFQAEVADGVALALGPRAFLVTRGPLPALAARASHIP